jgi:hypothetical protein
MTTLKFSTNKSSTLFLTFTIAIEQGLLGTVIRFAFLHSVFSVKINKELKITA